MFEGHFAVADHKKGNRGNRYTRAAAAAEQLLGTLGGKISAAGSKAVSHFGNGNDRHIVSAADRFADDGAGIDVEKVRKKAIENGLIHPDKVLTDQDAYQLIMQPGFSTADKISNISGRGVGLDVVKTMINNLKGTISINSAKGKGTSFIIKLPLTLAIIQGLLVRVGKEVYSIPIANVIESQCINISEINHIDNYEIMNVRNEVISVLRLSRLFGITESVQSNECYIVIVGTQEKKIGVMVDALIGEEDVVIKPLKDQFTNSPGIAGASILGDGSVSLIIDVGQLLELGVKQELLAQAQEQAQYVQ